MKYITLTLLFLFFTKPMFADVYVQPENECCYEISGILKEQNEILLKLVSSKDSVKQKFNFQNCPPVNVTNNCHPNSSDNFNLINFLAQLATILGLLFAIYTYKKTENTKRDEKIDAYKSLAKYFLNRIDSFINYTERQSGHFKYFTELIKSNPNNLYKLKFESNDDAQRINKIESEKLYEAINFLSKSSSIDNDYYYLLYGVGFISQLESQAKLVFDMYIDKTNGLSGKELEKLSIDFANEFESFEEKFSDSVKNMQIYRANLKINNAL